MWGSACCPGVQAPEAGPEPDAGRHSRQAAGSLLTAPPGHVPHRLRTIWPGRSACHTRRRLGPPRTRPTSLPVASGAPCVWGGRPPGAQPGGQSGRGLQEPSHEGGRPRSCVKARHLYKASRHPARSAAVVSGHRRGLPCAVVGDRVLVTAVASPGAAEQGLGARRNPRNTLPPRIFLHAYIHILQ